MFFNKKNNFKSAFTMSEMLMVIGVLGVLAMVTIPIMIQTLPSKEEQMHTKMSYLLEQIVQQMHDNEAYYPRTTDPAKAGFMNTDEVTINGVKYGGRSNVAPADVEANELARKEKFCKIFASQFSKANGSSVTCPETVDGTDPSFRSADGVDWWIPLTTFKENTDGQINGFLKIKIDVNSTDRGENCTEGTDGCRHPDIFYYYIKTNGSVTLSNPLEASSKTYEITTHIKTYDANGNEEATAGGKVEIAPIDPATGAIGTYSDADAKFKNLTANASYMLRAKPNTDYIPNWGTGNSAEDITNRYGYKKVRVTKPNMEVNLEFRQIRKNCIRLGVTAPAIITNENISTYLSEYGYRYNCKYENKGANNGDYKRVSALLDNYDYVGPNKGSYSYECSSSGNLSVDNGILSVCNLASGDYQLYGIPAEGMCINPLTASNTYTQNVRLGASDLNFGLSLSSCPEEIVEIPAPPSCERGTYVEGSNQCVLVMQYEEYNDGRPDKQEAAADKCTEYGMSLFETPTSLMNALGDIIDTLDTDISEGDKYWVSNCDDAAVPERVCGCVLRYNGVLRAHSSNSRTSYMKAICTKSPD